MSEIIKNTDSEAQLKVSKLEREAKEFFKENSKIIKKDVALACNKANQIIQEAEQTAEQLIMQAKALLGQMEQKIEEQRTKGFEKGCAEGKSELTKLIVAAEAHREQIMKDAEKEVIQMVYQITERMIGNAIENGAVVSVVKQAMKEAVGEKITIRVNPEELDLVRDAEPELTKRFQSLKSINILSDDGIEKGSCAIETEVGTIDAQLSAQLAAIKESLGIEAGSQEE